MRSLNRWLGTSTAFAFTFFASTATAQIGIEHQKLVAGDGAAGDEFGISLALDGDTMVVAADQENSAAGAVYVFTRQSDGTWTELQKLSASDAAAGAEFGYSVGVSGDWIAVGSRLEDVSKTNAGAVYLFERQGGAFSEVQKIRPNDFARHDHFGSALEIQGTRLVVGAPRNDDDGMDSGSAYVFEESGGSWSQVAKVTASNAEAGDLFPHTISLDGDHVLFSTIYDDNFAGAAYIFDRQGDGSWTETELLTANDKKAGAEFGSALALSGDRLLVAARLDQAGGTNAGSVYAFGWDGASWNQSDKFRGSDTAAHDQFGFSLDLDGNRAVAGAIRAKTSGFTNAGKTYVFERQGGGTWVQVARMFVCDPAVNDFQGWASAIDGHRIAVSAVSDDELGANAGAAYVAESEFLRSTDGISIITGGSVDFFVNLGVEAAAENYWVLGSYTGFFPGIVLHGVPVPLNWDLYLRMTLFGANNPPFSNSRGVLDGHGSATFTITVPGGLDPILVGLELHHAPLTYDSSSGIHFTSSGRPASFVLTN